MARSFTPRPSQREILQYAGGKLGISAVPGSGKTHTLSALAARIIAEHRLELDQEVLIVTLVNSAVDNFEARIADFVESRGLLPRLQYRVRTLHGLAHDIVREDPPLVGLDKQFSIVDETASISMIRDAALAWVHLHPELLETVIKPDLPDFQLRQVTSHAWPDLIEQLSSSFIRSAKDRRLSPEQLRLALARQPGRLPLAEMGIQIYSDYQRALTYRGAVDFDDLIRLAAEMLELAPDLLQRLRDRWPFILEDEAQDSSKLQQDIVSLLAGQDGNWVRVGDPNQAIFETFTTADPELLRDFTRHNPTIDMPESGRSQPSIIQLANFLIEWVMTQHPVRELRNALSRPLIEPAPSGDPQPNPPDDPGGLVFVHGGLSPDQEVREVLRSLEDWLPTHQDKTVAVLSSTNDHAARMVRALQSRNINYRELLRSTSPTRAAAGALSYVLGYLASPDSAPKLAQMYRVWRREWRKQSERAALYSHAAAVLGKMKHVEAFLSPETKAVSGFWLQDTGEATAHSLDDLSETERNEVLIELEAFQAAAERWQGATLLPIDQLILTIAQEIFSEPSDLAVAHKLALVMRQLADENPRWRLPELTPQLAEIAANKRRFIGFSSDDAGFDPDAYKGTVVVATMHKAKGLEWDRVYLMSVNDYDFPSSQPADQFISEKWFVRDHLNLEAEALAQLKYAVARKEYDYYEELRATRQSRLDYARERLRLLYVGITRARRELILSWNTGRKGDSQPALALAALQGWWEQLPR
jgi:ATP-dependent DNA helicase UvrD/PcrA